MAAIVCVVGLVAVGCTASPAPAASRPSRSGSVASVTVDGVHRTYRLYVPASAVGAGPVPLLVALHGGGSDGAHFEKASGFDQVADKAGFIVAYPDGVRPATGQRVSAWNAGDCCGYAARTGVDDVGFVQALIAAVSASHQVDARRIYVAGESNGGMLGYRLACQLGSIIAAVAVQSATLEYSPCQPAAPVSLLAIHGADDAEVPLAGGYGSGVSHADFTPPATAAAAVAAGDGCDGVPTAAPDADLAGAQVSTWPGCPAGIAVQLVVVPGAGHAWMSTTPALAWAFLAAHPQPNSR